MRWRNLSARPAWLLAALGVVILWLGWFGFNPVGAISVHGVCGAWGTLAVGLFAKDIGLLAGGGAGQLVTQAIGVADAFCWAFPVSLGIFLAIKYTVGLRANEAEEMEGLDLTEHGMYAYPPAFVAGVAPSPTAVPAHLRARQPAPAVEPG